MHEALLLLLQVVAGTPPARIELTQPVATTGCSEAVGEEIVVCSGRANPYRLAPPMVQPEPSLILPRAAISLFGGKAVGALETEAVEVPGGGRSNRLMARIKRPL